MVDAIASMNMFALAGQNLRVCRAVTPPDVGEIIPPPPTASALPTAAAIAAAAATAKIQAMDAISSNGSPSSLSNSESVLASNGPGLITGVTITPPTSTIPPPMLVTTLPLSLKLQTNKGSQNEMSSQDNSNSPKEFSGDSKNGNGVKLENQIESVQEEHQTLQQQEGVVIKGSSARQVLMHKLMRRNEVGFIL